MGVWGRTGGKGAIITSSFKDLQQDGWALASLTRCNQPVGKKSDDEIANSGDYNFAFIWCKYQSSANIVFLIFFRLQRFSLSRIISPSHQRSFFLSRYSLKYF